MYCFILSVLTVSFTYSASSGAKKCDALGLCVNVDSGASFDPTTGQIGCPWGMHLVSAPRRSDAYLVSTAPFGETGPTHYTPGQWIDIHVITVGPQYMKFLGILMYAVQYADVIGPEGCPEGCDGKDEVKLGMWEVTNDMFQVSEPCDGQAITHRNADPKPYHNIFRWKVPEAGSGDVIFRVVIKQGSTNMGHFWWPMTAGDLMLTEGPTEVISEWFAGDVSFTCTEICALESRDCDRSMPTGSLDHYRDHVGKTQSCMLPLLSTCSRTAPSRDEDGHCWFDNQDSELCDQPNVNICDSREVAGGSSRLCPCKPTDEQGWEKQTTFAPSTSPSGSPTASQPSLAPSASSPSAAPTRWFDPRWEQIIDGPTTCSDAEYIGRVCKKGCTYTQCKAGCAQNSRCKFFFFRPSHGACLLYGSCDVRPESSYGYTVRKIVVPTNQPTFNPTLSLPTSSPSVSAPTAFPSKQPTDCPTTTPTISQPTVTPTALPSVSPTNWFDPRWVEITRGRETCHDEQKITRACRGTCDFNACKESCNRNARCEFIYHRSSVCILYNGCARRRDASWGRTVRIIRVPTKEPTHVPTVSHPSSSPTVVPSDIPTATPTSLPSSSPSVSAPTAFPSKQPTDLPTTTPTISQPTVTPTALPSVSPTNWFEPRWVEINRGRETCHDEQRIARPCKNCDFNQCKAHCNRNERCQFAFWRESRNDPSERSCVLYSGCDRRRTGSYGITVQIERIPTDQPSRMPTISQPTKSPTVVPSEVPTFAPSSSEPTSPPTSSEPTQMPSDSPSVSFPSTSPTVWNHPRFYLHFADGQTCSRAGGRRIGKPCGKNCSFEFCRQRCEEVENCWFFYRGARGSCELFSGCGSTSTRSGGVDGPTWRKEIPSQPLE